VSDAPILFAISKSIFSKPASGGKATWSDFFFSNAQPTIQGGAMNH
jgi:hypothetical protein